MFDTTRPVILLAIASFACGGESAGPPPPQQATHRIGVRAPAGVGEFYDRPTGALFTPRGNNYVRLAPQVTPEGNTVLRSEEHTSELQSRLHLVCRLLLEKK